VAQGHGIGNHTYTHPALLFLDEDTLRNEIARAHRLMADLLHVQSTLFRPPWGLVSARVLDVVAGLGYRAVVGDVFPYDTNGPGADQIVRRVLRRVAPGSILILHDGYTTSRDVDKSQTVRALEQILPALLDQGYEFVPLARPLGPEQFRSA
jgi:peptidoglycan/xylan/chitin deacetylase (PgdA/CDA1 family)